MSTGVLIVIVVLLVGAILAARRYGMHWGSTAEERRKVLAGDGWLESGSGIRVRMTRATTIQTPPDVVWPWLAQLGRGAGWYSYDRLDNERRASARHIVSWVPGPQLGDATAIGYLRELGPGHHVAWWTARSRFWGAWVYGVMMYQVDPHPRGSRLLMRVSIAASGPTAPVFVLLFPIIDSIMACRQLQNLKARVERFGARTSDPRSPETGARDQFQFYHVIYASGGEAGVPGEEAAAKSRQAAIADRILSE